MPLPISRSETGVSGPTPYYPVRAADGRVVAFAPRGQGRGHGALDQASSGGGVFAVPRPQRSGERS